MGLRTPIIKNRLNEFLSFDDAEKREIILDIFKSYRNMEKQQLLHLVDSWLNSLAEMNSNEINSILYSYMIELSIKPSLLNEFNSEFVSSLIGILDKMPKNKKSKLLYSFFETILNIPHPHLFLNIVPPILLRHYK